MGLIKKLFAGTTLTAMLSWLSVEAWAHVKTNAGAIHKNEIKIERLKVQVGNDSILIKEIRDDIKLILQRMPRR